MPNTIAERIARLNWPSLGAELEARGHATTGPILTPKECTALAALYAEDSAFRSHIHMARHGFGSGEYKYFTNPLPEIVAGLREGFYPRLAETANRWQAALGGAPYPQRLAEYLKRCHEAGQKR